MNIEYERLRETIRESIQNSGLDVGAAYFILKDVYRDVENTYYATMNNELMNLQNTSNNNDNVTVNVDDEEKN